MLKRKLSAWFGGLARSGSSTMRRRQVRARSLRTIQRLESRALLTDASPWVVSMVRGSGYDTSLGGSVKFDIVFSEVVTGVDAADFSVIRTGSVTSTTVTVTDSGDHRNFQVTVGGIAGAGTLGLNLVDNGSIRDLAGKGLVNPGSVPAYLSYQSFDVGSGPESMALGDVNGDNIPDLVVANTAVTPTGTVSILLGNGNGTFQTQVTYSTGREPRGVALSDLNGDGKPDILVANQKDKTVGVLLGNGNGSFAAQQTHATGRDPNDLVPGDFNGDGKLDVAIVNTKDNSITILAGKGDGTFLSEQTFNTAISPVAIDAADLNGDGKSDIVVTHSTGNTVGVLLGNGNGTFQSIQTYATGTQPTAITHEDLNNDGKVDLAVAALGSNVVSVLQGNGDGTFQSQQQYSMGTQPGSVLLKDLDGDGNLDLATANRGSNNISVRSGKGDGTFWGAQTFGTATAPYAVLSGDVNGDGKRDLLTANRSSNSVSVLTSSLNGNFSGQVYQVAEPVLHWQGDVDGKWSTPGNWLENRAPVNGMELRFDVNTTGFAGRFLTENDLVGLEVGLIRINDNSNVGDFELRGNALAVTAGMIVQADSELRINLAGVTLSANQTFEFSPAATKAFWSSPIDLQGFGLVLQGGTTELSGVISGTGGVTFQAGSFSTNAAHTFTGPTTLKSTLVMDGSSVSSTTVGNGGILLGKGTIAAPVTVANGGRIQTIQGGGQQTSILQTGNLVSQVGSTLEFPVGGSTAGSTAATHGALQVSGTVTLAGNLSFQQFSGFTPSAGQELILISNDGTDKVIGTFAGLAEGERLYGFPGTENIATITYAGGDGNDVSLRVGPPPLYWIGTSNNLWSNPDNWDWYKEGEEWTDRSAPAGNVILNLWQRAQGNFESVNDIEGLTGDFWLNAPYTAPADQFSISGNAVWLYDIFNIFGEKGEIQIDLDRVTLSQPLSEIAFNGQSIIVWNTPIDLQSNALRMRYYGPHFEDFLAHTDVNGVISGTGGIEFQGDAIRLTATNTYTGPTDIYGILRVDGSIVSPTAVRDGGVLAGQGFVNAPVIAQAGGRVSPGLLKLYKSAVLRTGDLDMQSGSALDITIFGPTPGNNYEQYSQVSVTGTVKLAGEFNPVYVPNFGFVPTVGAEMIVISNDGTDKVVGTFAGLPEHAVIPNFLGTAHDAVISYKGGDGNDVSLKVLPQVLHWQGDVSADWGDSENWQEGVVPATGAFLIFDPTTPGFAGRFQTNNTLVDLEASITVLDSSAAGDFEFQGNAITLSRLGGYRGFGAFESFGDGVLVNFADVRLKSPSTIALLTNTPAVWNSPIDLQGYELVVDLFNEGGNHTNTINGVISGTGNVILMGQVSALTSASTWTGWTEVHGVWNVTGSTTSPTTVWGRLQGSGSIQAAVTVAENGRIVATDGPDGQASVFSTGSLTAQAGSILEFPIGGADAGNGFAKHGQLLVTGSVVLGGTLNYSRRNGFLPIAGQELILISNDSSDAVGGTFAGMPEGTVLHNFLGTGHNAVISYKGGDGNDVSLNVSPQMLHWQGDVDNKWSTPGNWLENASPVTGGYLHFDNQTTGFSGNFATVNDLQGLQVGSLIVNDTTSSGDFDFSGLPLAISSGVHVTGDAGFSLRMERITLSQPQVLNLNSKVTNWTAPLILDTGLMTVQGQSIDVSGNISGAGGLVVEAADLTLRGTNTYTGSTLVTGNLTHFGTSVSPTEVSGTGRLSGTGAIAASVQAAGGGRVVPGNPTGAMAVGGLNLGTGGLLETEIRGIQVGNATEGYDQIDVSGEVSLSGMLQISLPTGFVPVGGEAFVLIQNDGSDAVKGAFDGRPEGSLITVGDVTFSISYSAGDGNDVSLTTMYVTYVVSSTANSGQGSLSAAITNANTHPGNDVIVFQVSGAIDGPFPTITNPVQILGNSAPGYVGTPVVQLRGETAGDVHGLQFGAGTGSSRVQGLSITGFTGSGLWISAGHVAVRGNWIGVNPAGAKAANKGHGVAVQSGSVSIGGHTAADRNVISGNQQEGILIWSSTDAVKEITGNYIGTNVAGTEAMGNGWSGIAIVAGGSGVIVGGDSTAGYGNLISGNQGSGIVLDSAGAGNRISGNYIGTNAAGSLSLGNGYVYNASAGIAVMNMENRTVIIGTDGNGTGDAGEGNLVSGNYVSGIQILEFQTAGSHIIAGNRIGVDAGGTAVLPNRGHGLHIQSASFNRIGTNADGTSDADEANVISGNRNAAAVNAGDYASGILIEDVTGATPLDNLISGNFIGTDRKGIASLGNQGDGITIRSAMGTVVGVPDATDSSSISRPGGNLVRFNRGAGVRISGTLLEGLATEQFTTLRGNSFQSNALLAVDAGESGPTLNNLDDQTRDFPILTSATIEGTNLILTGFAPAGATVEFYLNSPRAGQVFGEGVRLIGRMVEGGATDSDTETGTYGPKVRNIQVSDTEITQNRFLVTIPLSEGIDNGVQLTAIVAGDVSEFSPLILIGEQGSVVAPEVTLDVTAAQLPWTQAEGEQFSLSGSFYDPDSRAWTATVDYGDGDGPVQLALTASKSFDLQHRYTTPGTYVVTVLVTDNGLATGTATLTVHITNEIPKAQFDTFTLTRTVNEGETVSLAGSFTDGGGAHVVLVEWGDGNTSTLTLASGVSTFSTTHTYTDDTNSAGSVTASDIYSVRITIRDSAEATGLTSPDGLFLIDVTNVVPEFSAVTLNGQNPGTADVLTLVEGDTLVLTGILTDPGTTDEHRLRITWGDGETSLVTLPVGDRQFQGLTGLSHVYRNDDEDGLYTVQLELWDDDQPLSVATWIRTIAVTNQSPNSIQLTPVPSLIDEAGTVSIAGTFSDAGIEDGHQVRVIWGDGSPDSILNLAAGVTSFSGDSLTHQYLNNPSGASTYTIQVEISDLDNSLAWGTGSTSVTVRNVAPVVSALRVVRADGQSGVIAEGDAVTVTGSFSDVSPLDRHLVMMNWGDGRQSAATVDAMTRTFTATHVYYDNYVAAAITATVTDGQYSGSVFNADGGEATSAAVFQTVTNVAPTAVIAPVAGSTPTVTQLTVDVVDPGLDDLSTLSYLWEINGSDGYETKGTSRILTFDSTEYYAPLIRVTVQDKDGGSGTFTVVAIFGTTASETITVFTTSFMRSESGSGDPDGGSAPAAPIGGGFTWPNQILVLGFGGEDLLDASNLPSTHLAILDGGQQQDYLIGGAGADIFYPNDGNDSVDGGAGDDRFVLTPNSTLTVIDTSGFNTLDFSRSAFSDGSGITFDLTKIRNSGLPDADLDAQVVSTVGTSHIVAAFGTFQQLIGSTYGDSLTARSGATVYGGAGADTLYVGSNTTGVTLNGGADDDFLVVSGTDISGLTFGGDDGLDVMRNLGTITDLTFGGGADDDILENTGSITGTLIFGGDDGLDILTNTGSIGVLNFNGGADDDIFINNGSAATLLTYGGDSDILLNTPGTIGTLVFSGDSGADIFANLGTITTLTFTGGADDDVFVNVGTMTSLNFGGDDDVLLSNCGTIGTIGTLVFSGDDGADVLQNLGVITSLTFNGGADDDVLSNLIGGTLAGLVFGGDDGSDLLRNEGVIADLLFSGGADDDILLNTSGGAVQGLAFGGDDGSDLLTNYGSIDGLTFTGGADDDVLTNFGSLVGTLLFTGDAGADILQNSGTLATLTFSGGADDDIFVNLASGLAGGITFAGDDGIDVFQNSGDVTNLSFGGGADDDLLVNQAGAEITTLVFGGDRELNSSGGLSQISNFADDGTDTLLNFGSVGTLTFFGGADDDVLVNQLTGTVTALSFGGDDGVDSLRNTGHVTTLTFGGGADDDTLINTGTIFGTLVFGGDREFDSAGNLQGISTAADDGVDTFANYGTVQSLQFTGGADDDVLLNQTGASISTLVFQGDTGSDVLRNDGLVATLTFSGGADDDVLINTGASITTLLFGGDAGNDILYNTGASVGALTFDGGADDDVLLNTGSGLSSLEFAGGADNDILQNSGNGITELVFSGDHGSDILRNTGNSISTLVFGGGADDDVLFSSGELLGGIVFGGDIDASTGAMIAGTNRGNDLLIVQGSGAGSTGTVIVFRGDDGADAFRYSASGFAALTFEGGADDDVFQTNTDYAAKITFSGGADDDVLENNGLGVTELVFNGDSGNDTLYNNGHQLPGLIFHGGSDDDTLVNTGSELTGLVFTGDSGADVLVNTGNDLSGVTFNGGADDDVFQNSGTSLTLLTFYGDAGDDRFLNRATAVQLNDVVFHGDAGADILLNYAGGVTDLTFAGGADDDIFQNSGVSVSGLLFEGGADDDVFLNQSAGAITDLTFGGDDGGDTLLNTGAIIDLLFGGGADDDILVNRGTVTTLIFGGDQELASGGLGAVIDAADDGSDTLLNDGAVTVLQFSGGADDDLLVSNGPVGTLTFEGGADDDTLQNNGQVVSLLFEGGADDDVFYNNADGAGSLLFRGDDGVDTFVNKGSDVLVLTFTGGADSDTLRVHGTGIGTLVFEGGADIAGDSFHYNATGSAGSSVTYNAGPGDDYFAWRGSADTLTYNGGAGADQAIILGSGNLTLDGGTGDDTFYFQSNPQADVLLVETYAGAADDSRDTLDFSAFSGGALNLDLRLIAKQSQSSVFAITLSDGNGIENVIGTPLADVISGNSRDNGISGARYGEDFSGSAAGTRGTTQWVLLDFDTWTEDGEHVYTDDERLAIATRIETVYRGPDAQSPWFDVRVVLNRSEIPVADGEFALIDFNRTPDFGRPGGLASEIDPGNLNYGGTAIVQVNGLLGGVITAEDISEEGGDAGQDKADLRPVGDEEIGASKPAATSENFILLSAKIGAHELGHLIGLRHQDSFGPIGFGLHDPPGSAAYKPVYAGPVAGVETFDHLMGSGASVGSDRFNDLKDLFFGERELIKLGYAFSDVTATITDEATSPHSTAATSQPLTLITVDVPNTLTRGLNASRALYVQMQSVEGTIAVDSHTGKSENDWYSFTGTAGTILNVEVYSNSLVRYGTGVDDYVDSITRVWYEEAGILTLVPFYGSEAINDDIFEPTDSSIVDLVLPRTGTYYIEVDTFSRDPADPLFDPTHPSSPLNPANPGNILGYPELLDRFLDTRDDTDAGHYHLFISGFASASATDGVDTIVGYGGIDTIDGGSGDSYALTLDPGAMGTTTEGSGFSRTLTLVDRAAISWSGSTVNYGDGSGEQPLVVDSSGTFVLDHIYADDGLWTVTMNIQDDIGQTLTTTLQVSVSNEAPTILTLSGPSAADERSTQTYSFTASDPGADTFVVEAISGGSRGIVSNVQLNTATGTGTFDVTFSAGSGTTVLSITLQDSDGASSGSTTLTVTVNNVNDAPTAIGVSADTIAENSATQTLIGTLSATDPDTGDSFTWTLVSGAGADDNASFLIDGSTLKSNAVFDYETRSVYSVRVRTTDAGGLWYEQVLAITVTDVEEDVTLPVSRITTLPNAISSPTITLTATGSDPGANATGIREYDFYYSTGGAFSRIGTSPAASPTIVFVPAANTTYWFRSIATDHAGNEESKSSSDTWTRVGDITPPSSTVTAVSSNSSGRISLQISGNKQSGAKLSEFDVYVMLDGAAATLIGTCTATSSGVGQFLGSMSWQGKLDGVSHTYSFYSRARDLSGNVEAAPVGSDVSLTATFAAASLTATGIDVQKGANQRSYVRYLDVLFSDDPSALLATGRVAVERFSISAASAAAGTGSAVTGYSVATSGNNLKLDFGASGIGGQQQNGDGFYRVRLDVNGNGVFTDSGDAAFEFFRLYGDANGNGTVDVADTNLISSQVGRSGANLDGDIDGNGLVTITDRTHSIRQRGRKLLGWMLSLLDD